MATGVVFALFLALASSASAANTRVSIADYAWSNPAVQIDLGEKVTWDWLGPDLAHSVTGVSANDLQWDSDPSTDAPSHRPGDSFTVQFAQPGVYQFQCKLHAFVRGEVIVSETPGDPNSDPGPRAPLNLDVKRPTLGGIRLRPPHFRGRSGTTMTAAVSERGTLDGEYYLLRPGGKRTYNGYKVWKTFIGLNRFALGAPWKHFKARPGRYEVVLRATDQSNNTSKPVTKRFTIDG
jgi:plastocyanin